MPTPTIAQLLKKLSPLKKTPVPTLAALRRSLPAPIRTQRAPAIDPNLIVRYRGSLQKLAQLQDDKRYLDRATNAQNALFTVSGVMASFIPFGQTTKVVTPLFQGKMLLDTFTFSAITSQTMAKIIGVTGSVGGYLSSVQMSQIKQEVDTNETLALDEFNQAATALKREVVSAVKSESSERFVLGKIDEDINEAKKEELTSDEKLARDLKELENLLKSIDKQSVSSKATVEAWAAKKKQLEAQVAKGRSELAACAAKVQTLQSQRNLQTARVQGAQYKTQQVLRALPVYKRTHNTTVLNQCIQATLTEDQRVAQEALMLHRQLYGNTPLPVAPYVFLPADHPARQKDLSAMVGICQQLMKQRGRYERSEVVI